MEYLIEIPKLLLIIKLMDSKEVLKLYMQCFSEHLKEIRKKKYNSMDAVAQNSVFDSSNYNKYENGKGNPTIETILKMASVFKIPPKELFDFDFDIEKYKIDE
ncbi:helix-turn-helix domain-containing protein [Chryseobacterium sp. RG1]|uniref:Helix-turn-helix domain-containing protein n=1 Tax=Chryseobacterium tagetis TaxID=2801334 RepID=A0ABS8A656_9FLAO|nr:helix-turn-helix transcriptional regulator [Chryseobacterium tagetis]MCA6069456.1 helix-turn-helix domain-containing protein [Chryseobacterium tagetis]